MYYEKLKDLGIELRNKRGQQKVVCPKCSPTRKNKREPCLSVNVDTGDYNCHNTGCEFRGTVRTSFRDNATAKKEYKYPPIDDAKKHSYSEGVKVFFEKRGISEDTLKKFFIYSREEWMPQIQGKTNVICFPYFGLDLKLTNIKFRDQRKNFKLVSGAKLIPFNLNSIINRKFVIITEGEIDAMSIVEAGIGTNTSVDTETGEVIENFLDKWAVISVPNGASLGGNAKLEYLDNCAEALMEITEFIVATDGDEAGEALKEELCRRLGVEKCRLIKYPKAPCVPLPDGGFRPPKDLNEVLVHMGKDVVRSIILASEYTQIEGIYYVLDIADEMMDNFRKGVQLAPTTRFRSLDNNFRWKYGDINVWTGWANEGKTTIFLQLALTKSIYDGWKWAIFSPENFPPTDFYDDLIEMYCGKWIGKITEEEYTEALSFLNDHFFYVYPEDSHDLLSIHEKFRYLILKHGIDGVLIDPWNQLDSMQKSMEREDMYLSRMLKDVKRFALLNKVSYNIIAHPKNPTYNADKSLPVADKYDLHGGSMWGNKADQILSYYRPNSHIDKTSPNVELWIQKTKRRRTGGENGVVPMHLDWSKKRYCIDNIYPCDPILAKQIVSQEGREIYAQEQLSFENRTDFPEVKAEGEDAPF